MAADSLKVVNNNNIKVTINNSKLPKGDTGRRRDRHIKDKVKVTSNHRAAINKLKVGMLHKAMVKGRDTKVVAINSKVMVHMGNSSSTEDTVNNSMEEVMVNNHMELQEAKERYHSLE